MPARKRRAVHSRPRATRHPSLPVGPNGPEPRAAPMGQRFVGNVEGLEARPAGILLRGDDVVFAERLAVGLLGILAWTAVPDVRARDDHRRTIRVALRFGDRTFDLVEIVDVGD